MRLTRVEILVALLGTALLFGCDDNPKKSLSSLEDGGAGGAGGDSTGGAGGTGGGAGGTGGAADMDAGAGGTDTPDPDTGVAPDAEIQEPDAAPPEPDAEVIPVDAAAPALDAGMSCEMDPDICEFPNACVDGACRPDVSGRVFRLVDGEVSQPGGQVGASLTLFLGIAVEGGDLNLLFEPAGYQEDGSYRFYVGTGTGELNAQFAFRHDRAIQAADGEWRQGDSGPFFQQGDAVPFRIDIPDGSVIVPGAPLEEGYFVPCEADDMPPEVRDNEEIFCFQPITTNVRVTATPFQEADSPRLEIVAQGWLSERDAEGVTISVGNEQITLTSVLANTPLDFDANGDGVNESWRFRLAGTAEPVAFDDPNCARRANPPARNLEVCEDR